LRILPLSTAPLAARAALRLARRVTVYGERAASLGAHLAAEHASELRRVLFICGDNRFDPYAIARWAREFGAPAEEVLGRILVARAFTGDQLAELVRRLEPASGFDVVIISGFCTSFYDEDLSHTDAARLFYRSLWHLVSLAGAGLPLLLAQSETEGPARRSYFLRDLCRASHLVLRLDGRETFTLERRGAASALPRLAALDAGGGDGQDRHALQ
jgi:hypothetical protein